jgi:hypothetical protein
MVIWTNGAQVDPPLRVDLDTTQEGDIEFAARGQVEEIGQRHKGTGPMEQRGIDR